MKTGFTKKNLMIALGLAFANLMLAQQARSAVTVFFEQVGSDVKVSWSGSLLISGGDTNPNDNANVSRVGATLNFSHVAPTLTRAATVGASSSTGLTTFIGARTAETEGNWGFSSGFVYWSTDIIGAGTDNFPTRLDYDPTKQLFLLPNTTLAAINAGAFNNTLAYTANTTNDTISYTTVPEPASAMLLAFAGSTFFLRRRR